jgi:ABC-type nitrate/sulfonate/bicarbonate transport system permease component
VRTQIITFLRRLILVGGGLYLWSLAVSRLNVPEYIVPPPQKVLATLMEDTSLLWRHFTETFKEWLTGLSGSVMLALIVSLAAFSSPFIEKHVRRFLVISQAVPYLTVAPLLLLWFGLGSAPKIILILLTCTFPIAQLTLAGLHNAREKYSVLATILRFTPVRALQKLYIPAALPDFLEGLKISVTYAFVSTVLAELIGSEAGLGVYLSRAQAAYRTDRVLLVVLFIVCFSLLCTFAINRLSRRLLFWRVENNV